MRLAQTVVAPHRHQQSVAMVAVMLAQVKIVPHALKIVGAVHRSAVIARAKLAKPRGAVQQIVVEKSVVLVVATQALAKTVVTAQETVEPVPAVAMEFVQQEKPLRLVRAIVWVAEMAFAVQVRVALLVRLTAVLVWETSVEMVLAQHLKPVLVVQETVVYVQQT